MYPQNNKITNNLKIILISLFLAMIIFAVYYFISGKKSYDPTVKIEDKNITKESKKLLTDIDKYREAVEDRQKIEEKKLNESLVKDGKVENEDKIKNPEYIPENNIDGRKETEKTKKVVTNKKLKTAKELGILEKQRVYILKSLAEPRLVFDDYYTTQFDQFFQTPAEYEKVKLLVTENYLNTYPERAEKLFTEIDNEALKYLQRESLKYDLGKNDPAIIKTAQELGVDFNKI